MCIRDRVHSDSMVLRARDAASTFERVRRGTLAGNPTAGRPSIATPVTELAVAIGTLAHESLTCLASPPV
eukprot:441464-Lingulodinium_polyedra.AAC.1